MTMDDKDQQEADRILHGNPLEFLVSEVQKQYIGEVNNVQSCIHSLITLNPAIESLYHIQHVGNTGKGKSTLGLVCQELLPMEMRFEVNSMSPKFLLYYSKTQSLKNKMVIIDDATDSDIELLKKIGDNKGPATYGTIINGKPVVFKFDAEPLVWFSTVSPLKDDGAQLSSRYFMMNIDESEDHHREVLEFIQSKGNKREPVSPVCAAIIHRCINNILFDRIEIIPEWKHPYGSTVSYRDLNRYKSLIQASAVLNYCHREINDMVLEGTQEDIDIAHRLWTATAHNNLLGLNNTQLKAYQEIKDYYEGIFSGVTQDTATGISVKELADRLNMSSANAYKVLNVLEDLDLIGSDGYKSGKVFYPLV